MNTKISKYVRPANCASLTLTRVNSEIWDKLSVASKARDIRSQRVQNSTVHAMVAITAAADNLVGAAKVGESLTKAKLSTTNTSLVDALGGQWVGGPGDESEATRRSQR